MSLVPQKSKPASSVTIDAWLLARERYLADLTDEEKVMFSEASLENLFYNASAAQKLHEDGSYSRAASKKIQPLLGSLEQYGKALDVFSNASPTIMCPLWGSVRVLLHIASVFGKYFDKLQHMFGRIGDVLPRFRVYEKLFPDHGHLINALSVVYVDIIVFCIDAKRVFRKGKKQSAIASFKLLWRPFERQFDEVLDNFRIHKENVEKGAGLAHMIEAKKARSSMRLEKELRRRLLKQLSSVDQEQKQRRSRKIRHSNTGAWLAATAQFKDWVGSKKSVCLWCHGIPGCGKTILTTRVVDHLTNAMVKGVAVAYYYCDFSDQNTLMAPTILGCLIKQILENIEIPDNIARQIDQYYKCGARTPASEELVGLLAEVIALFSEVYIAIDGVDECGSQERADILSSINRLVSYKKLVVKVFISSRDDIDIRRSLIGHCKIGISGASIQPDISSYVSAAVSAKVHDGHLLVKDSNLVNTITEDLSHGAQGMFLWVALQLDELCGAASDSEIRDILRNLPKDLAETYARILRRIRASNRGSEKMAMARKVFEWISCARRPLSVEELKEAIAFEPTDRAWRPEKIPTHSSRLIEACGNLIIVDDDQTVRLAHYTVLQFLTSASTDVSVADFHFESLQAELHAGEVCVAYLSFSDFGDQITKSEPNHAMRDMQLLESAFLSRTTYLQGFSRYFWDTWNVVRESTNPENGPRIDFGRVVSQAKPSPKDLHQKYQFLKYVIDHWVWHTTRFSEQRTGTWHLFRDLALERQTPFDFRPWGEILVAKDLPYLPLFLWAVESGHATLLTLLRKPPRGVDLRGYCERESKYAQSPLVPAARHGHAEVLELLLATFDAGVPDLRLLHLAVTSGRSKPVMVLLDHGCEADAENPDGRTALEVAVENGFELTVKELLIHGAKVDRKGPDGRTALEVAVENGFELTVKELLTHGAEADREGYNGRTALEVAAENGFEPAVKELLTHGAEPNRKGSDGHTALEVAVKNGHETVVRLLVEKGADLAARDGTEWTALHLAAEKGHEAVVRLLVEKGADLVARDGTGWTALHLAAKNGHEAVVRLLVEKGADLAARNWREWAALHLAAEEGHEAVVRLLVEKGADLAARDRGGWTALHLAAGEGREAVVRLLVEKGADLAARNGGGGTALHLAAENGHETVVRLLVEKGADLAARNRGGGTALHLAAENGHETVVRLLVEKGADLAARDGRERAALHLAAEEGHEAVVRLLVEKGADADVAAEDRNGWTAQRNAVRGRHERTVQFLTLLTPDVNRRRGSLRPTGHTDPEVDRVADAMNKEGTAGHGAITRIAEISEEDDSGPGLFEDAYHGKCIS